MILIFQLTESLGLGDLLEHEYTNPELITR